MHITQADVAVMRQALELARQSATGQPGGSGGSGGPSLSDATANRRVEESADIPVAAIVTDSSGTAIAAAANRRRGGTDPTAHAEIAALRLAGEQLGTWRLDGCSLFVTLEPCPMCAGAAVSARVRRIVFGAWNPDYGACGSLFDIPRDRRLHHRPEVVSGVLADECADLVRTFFARARRAGADVDQ